MDNCCKNERNYNLDFFRFIFSIIIVYYHLLNSNIIPFTNGAELYVFLKGSCAWAGNLVEFFLLIGGYFLYEVFNKKNISVKAFFENRISRLWPVLFVYILLSFFMNTKKGFEETFLDIFFLRCTGIVLQYKSIVWYVGPFFWCSIFSYALLYKINKKYHVVVFSFIAYLCYSVNINNLNGNVGRNVVYNWVSLGMLRVLGGISIGILLNIFKNTYLNFDEKPTIMKKVLFTLLELGITGIIMYLLLVKNSSRQIMTLVILYSIMLLLLVSKKGCFFSLLDNKWVGSLGRYSYSIYVMQQISFSILSNTLWRNERLLHDNVVLSLLCSVIFSVMIGIISYYLIELPLGKQIKNYFSKKTVLA